MKKLEQQKICFLCKGKCINEIEIYDETFCSFECANKYEDLREERINKHIGKNHYVVGLYTDKKTFYFFKLCLGDPLTKKAPLPLAYQPIDVLETDNLSNAMIILKDKIEGDFKIVKKIGKDCFEAKLIKSKKN